MRGAGVWQVENVLDAADASAHAGEFEPHTLSIEVEDRPGVLNQARPANDLTGASKPHFFWCHPPWCVPYELV